MDKSYLPYFHNGKKFHTLPDGQCLYRHPKGNGVEIVAREVSSRAIKTPTKIPQRKKLKIFFKSTNNFGILLSYI